MARRPHGMGPRKAGVLTQKSLGGDARKATAVAIGMNLPARLTVNRRSRSILRDVSPVSGNARFLPGALRSHVLFGESITGEATIAVLTVRRSGFLRLNAGSDQVALTRRCGPFPRRSRPEVINLSIVYVDRDVAESWLSGTGDHDEVTHRVVAAFPIR